MHWFLSSGGSTPSFQLASVAANSVYALAAVPADVDGDGHVDVVSANYGSGTVAWYRSSGNSPIPQFSLPQNVSSSLGGPVSVQALDIDGDVDVVAGGADSGLLQWFENVVCPRGQYSTTGNAPCTPCRAGTFGARMGMSSAVCDGPCPVGQYSQDGWSSCSNCSAGYVCPTSGSTSPNFAPCGSGRYSAAGWSACVDCNGGYVCGVASPSATQTVCGVGQHSAAGASVCLACPAGQSSVAGSAACDTVSVTSLPAFAVHTMTLSISACHGTPWHIHVCHNR